MTVGEPTEFSEQGVSQGRSTRFTVLNRVVIRIFQGTHLMTLDVEATGQPILFREGERLLNLAEFRVSGGARQARELQ